MTRVIDKQQVSVMARRKIRLLVVFGPNAGREAVGEESVLQVGTQPGNTLVLEDDAVSRIHVEIASTADGILVRDMASTNGTWLLEAGVRVTEAYVPSDMVLQIGRSQVQVQALDQEVAEVLSPDTSFELLTGKSAVMRALFSTLQKVAPTDETVLITGETGTGKELCAQSLVSASRRAHNPFVIVDCGGIPHTLLESELFGHVRGAFTGAESDYVGAFERANGGTVFLDEIGELPPTLQTRLLRAVETRTVRRVGSPKPIPLDIRILAATNRCLEEEVNHGGFRADLYYRLSVIQVRLPPLRERSEDIELLAREMLDEMEATGLKLDEAALQQLKSYRWPGNVRELRNHLKRMSLGGAMDALSPGGAPGDAQPGLPEQEELLSYREAKDVAMLRFEHEYLSRLIRRAAGNISQAARLARTDRAHLSRLLSKHGLSPGRE
jgi:DNA-binding NtrC family response regulator